MIEDYGTKCISLLLSCSTRLFNCICVIVFCAVFIGSIEYYLLIGTAVIGANSVVSEGAYVEKKSYLAPDSVLLPGQRIPAGQVCMLFSSIDVQIIKYIQRLLLSSLSGCFFHFAAVGRCSGCLYSRPLHGRQGEIVLGRKRASFVQQQRP